jgi:hypothetical protein
MLTGPKEEEPKLTGIYPMLIILYSFLSVWVVSNCHITLKIAKEHLSD